MAIIKVNHLTKEYRLGAMQGIKQTLLNTAARLTGKKAEERPLFKALDDVSFSIEQGEVVGIIGHNGAGKSTLLKMLAKISTPTSGNVKVNGRIAPLIEVGAGFVPDFTGRENVYLNGAILGMSRQEVDRKFDEIVEFAEMAEFIDTPVKRYSSGMKVKLAFAVATSIESEILIVDEVLAVGDLAFQRKCFDRMEDMIKRQGKTVLLVSHNIRQVERICSRTILLNHGCVSADGDSQEVCGLFFAQSDEKIRHNAVANTAATMNHQSTGDAELIGVQVINSEGELVEKIHYQSDVTLAATFHVYTVLQNPSFGFGIHTTDLLYLATNISESAFSGRSLEPGIYTVRFHIHKFPFLPGVYSIRLGLTSSEGVRAVYYAENLAHIQVVNEALVRPQAMREGFVLLDGTWQLDEERSQLSADISLLNV
jgi:ABC-type polysaccharide/polyol phosphate transport system ATPase subunit